MRLINTQMIKDTISAVLNEGGKDDSFKKGFADQLGGDRASILQESRHFNQTPLDPTRCFNTLTKIIRLVTTEGEVLTRNEQVELFFGITKLFQSSNDKLRRLVYLAIKSVDVGSTESFIITSSLTRDMNSSSDIHRANALRALGQIVDASMVNQIERYLKTAVVDKSPLVASAALRCGMNLLPSCPEVVRRWMNEVVESVRSRHPAVQFLALALLYELKRSDRVALRKVVISLTASPLRSPFAECLLIRYATRILRSEKDAATEKGLLDYLENRLRSRSDMIVLEAARALCQIALPGMGSNQPSSGILTTSVDLTAPITALQIMLSSQYPTVRFAAVSTLNKVAQQVPSVVSRCNDELETLLTDSNRSISTFSLTTLLKTGHESGIERLIKQISSLMADITDSFRLEVVAAVRHLVVAYPSKYKSLLTFLASQLREEGSFAVKRELVGGFEDIIHHIPQSFDTTLTHLCEFIEDCEYPQLCSKILTLLGREAPKTASPSKFIRFIYNRLILETAPVRIAAVEALARLGFACPFLARDIATLLETCTADNDDEIRDRARLYVTLLNNINIAEPDGEIVKIPTGPPISATCDMDGSTTDGRSEASLEELLSTELPVALDALLEQTEEWIKKIDDETEDFVIGDFSGLPTEAEYSKMKAEIAVAATAPPTAPAPRVGATAVAIAPASRTVEAAAYPQELEGSVAEALTAVLASAGVDPAGTLCHSTPPSPLTESEVEYSVECIKHIFSSDIMVLEFIVTNTLPDTYLTEVRILPVKYDDCHWKVLANIVIEKLVCDSPSSAYIIVKRLSSPVVIDDLPERRTVLAPLGTFHVQMHFVVHESLDDISGSTDQYSLEPVNISFVDYVVARRLRMGEFRNRWNTFDESQEVVAKLSLGRNFESLLAAVTEFVSLSRLFPCDSSEEVPGDVATHDLLLSGAFIGSVPFLCLLVVVMAPKHGCLVKVTCRSRFKELSEKVAALFCA